jgi:hypothetical protein
MAGNLRALPGAEMRVKLTAQLRDLLANAFQLRHQPWDCSLPGRRSSSTSFSRRSISSCRSGPSGLTFLCLLSSSHFRRDYAQLRRGLIAAKPRESPSTSSGVTAAPIVAKAIALPSRHPTTQLEDHRHFVPGESRIYWRRFTGLRAAQFAKIRSNPGATTAFLRGSLIRHLVEPHALLAATAACRPLRPAHLNLQQQRYCRASAYGL